VTSLRHRQRIKDAYNRLRDHGMNVLPLCPPDAEQHRRLRPRHTYVCGKAGKVPLGGWEQYQRRRATPEDVRRMVAESGARGVVPNLGVVMGVTSLNLVSVDADGPAAVEWCHVRLGERLLRTACFRTGRGVRWLFRVPDGRPLPASGVLAPGVDLLSAGRQSVVPPSLHASGAVYAWHGCDARTWPRRLLAWDDALAAPATRLTCGGRGPSADGVPLAEGGRNAGLFGMARALHWRGAGQREVRACLTALNELCRPPLPAAELDRIARSACSYSRATSRTTCVTRSPTTSGGASTS
jgi:hypothetical protein